MRLSISRNAIATMAIAATAATAAAIATTALFGAATAKPQMFDEISAHRINLVDPDGTVRMVLHNGPAAPPARMRGQDYPRSVDNLAGITFFAPDGTETGGIASSRQPNGAEQTAMIIDYTGQPTDGVQIGKQETADGKTYVAGIFVSDRRPYVAGPVRNGTEGIERIALTNADGQAGLILSGTDGKPRIRITVGKDNEPAIEILDGSGHVTRRLLQAQAQGR